MERALNVYFRKEKTQGELKEYLQLLEIVLNVIVP